ncbi:MAG: MFS transporter [Verrucomicrobia bacterium]|nr:MFS transporter [Verrucomicrobiota bacterium]
MKNPSLLVIILSVFIDLIGFGIVMPLLPIYGKTFGANGFEIGVMIASFSAMQFLFAPAWGRLSDRIGRRPVILISNAGSAISYAGFALASTVAGSTGFWLLLCSRIFAGICGANISVASAYIADISPPEKRTQRMGLIGMAFGLGFVFGPALGAFSYKAFGLSGPGWVAAGFCLFNFLLGCFVLVESRKASTANVRPRPSWEQWAHTLRQPTVGLVIGIYFLGTFCFACFESTFSLLVKEVFLYDADHAGYLFAYCGVLAALVQAGPIRLLNKRFGEQRLITGSLIVVAASFLFIAVSGNLPSLLASVGLLAIGWGMNRPPALGLISLKTSADEQGATLGVAQGAASLARIFGPLVASPLYAAKHVLPYFICAGISLAAGIAAWHYLCRPESPLAEPELEEAG